MVTVLLSIPVNQILVLQMKSTYEEFLLYPRLLLSANNIMFTCFCFY